MHANALSAAVKRHGHLASKAAELTEALKADPKGFSEDEIQEIFTAITEPVGVNKALNGLPAAPAGKQLYDKWRGSWVPTKTIRNPFSGQDMVIQWRFDRLEQKANKTNIPLTEREAELFNTTRRLQSATTPTEQLYLAGTAEPIFDNLPNPFEVQTV
jgi:hypothetical protein